MAKEVERLYGVTVPPEALTFARNTYSYAGAWLQIDRIDISVTSFRSKSCMSGGPGWVRFAFSAAAKFR